MIIFKISKSNWTSGRKRIINLDFEEGFSILISKSFLVINLRDFEIKEVDFLIFKSLKAFFTKKRIFWRWSSSLSITIRKMKGDSKNIKRRKLINLIRDYEVSLNIVSIYMEIFKIDIDIVFERLKFELV